MSPGLPYFDYLKLYVIIKILRDIPNDLLYQSHSYKQ